MERYFGSTRQHYKRFIPVNVEDDAMFVETLVQQNRANLKIITQRGIGSKMIAVTDML